MHFYSVHFVAMILPKLFFKVEAILNVSFLMRYSISYIKSRDQTFSSCNILFMSILEILFHEVQWKKHFTVYHRFYTMFKTTSIVRCAKYWLMFFKSNSVWFKSPISQYPFALFLTSWSLLFKVNLYLHWKLRIS